MYFYGRGIDNDDNEAAKWIKKSAQQGDDKAQYFLGLMYCDGRGVERNRNEGMKCFEKSAAQGNKKAQ
jgi:hypothetical protein